MKTKRRKPDMDGGDRPEHFAGGYAMRKDRDRMLARLGIGPESFGPRGVNRAKRQIAAHLETLKELQ